MDSDRVIQLTKIKMDEVSPDNQGEIITPVTIEELIAPALRTLIMITPSYLLETSDFYQESSVEDNIVDNGDQTGYIILPSDFLRFISFKLDVWNRPVTKTITENTQLYSRQKNIYTRGGIDKPVCALLSKPSVGKILEYYSTINSDHTVDHAYYVPEQDIEDFQDDELIEPLTWLIAVDYFNILERNDLSKIAQLKVQEFYEAKAL